MGELTSPAPGGVQPAASAAEDARRATGLRAAISSLVVAGVLCLLFAEQIITGWLPLAERVNISRRDLNWVELLVIVGMVIWGLLTLWTAYTTWRRGATQVATYFADRASRPSPAVIFSVATLAVIGLVSLFLAEQTITGWLALGERIDISRRDINFPEILLIVFGLIAALVSLRTFAGWVQRATPALAWSQWVFLVTAIIGMVIVLSGLFDTPMAIPADGSSIAENIAGLLALVLPGLIIFFSSIAAYQIITAEVDTRADQVVRNLLSRTPGAGAIVGFAAILIFFGVASDLFLEPRALAGALTTNITRGVVAIGITMLMISGEFDLSVGSQLGSIGLFFLLTMTEGIFGLPPFSAIPAVIATFIFATVLGFINGFITIRTGIPSFIVTLGTLLAYRAIPLVIIPEGRILRYADYRLPPPTIEISRVVILIGALLLVAVFVLMGRRLLPRLWRAYRDRHENYTNDTDDFRDLYLFLTGIRFLITAVALAAVIIFLLLGAVNQISQLGSLLVIDFFQLMNGQLDFLPGDVNLRSGVIWWFSLVIILQFILTQTPYGSYVFAVGGNPGAARAQGINVNFVKVMNFILCSWMVAFAAIMDVSRVQSVDSTRGDGLELEVIAASVIGGSLLSGGYGSIVGALLGVLIFGMLRTGLVLIGLNPRIFNGVIGVIIIVAVVINTFVRRERR
ncbi:MAG: hypothetical protein GYB67_17410 [Chloroflexi bacterium]|nr:hypothetical protein [Chloroflexota bacterium]